MLLRRPDRRPDGGKPLIAHIMREQAAAGMHEKTAQTSLVHLVNLDFKL